MSVKSIIIKVIVGFVIIGLLLGLIFLLAAPEKDETEKSIQLIERDEKKAERINLSYDNGFSLDFTDGKWKMEGMDGIGVNQAYATALVKSVSELSSPLLAEENCPDLSKYGIDKPFIEITTTYTDGEEVIKIGNQSGSFRYVALSSSDDVYVVPQSDLYMVMMDKMEYLDKRALSTEGERITSITVDNIVLEQEDDWYLKSPYIRLADNSKIEKILTSLSTVTAIEILPYEDVKEYFKEDKCSEVTIESENEDIRFKLCTIGETYSYLLHEGGRFAYKVANTDLPIVEMSAFDLIVKNIAPVYISKVKEIKLTSPEETTYLSIDAPASEAPLFYKNSKQVTEESFRSFYQKLMALNVTGEGTASGAAKYAIEIICENEEKTDIRFISKDESDFAVSINGKTQFAIAKKSVTDIFKEIKYIEEV